MVVLRGRLLSWLSLVALGVLSVVAALVSAGPALSGLSPAHASQPIQGSLAGFAGYHLSGAVDDVSAYFAVPAILSIPPKAQYATASTWIGAQNVEGDFIQIGITETQDAFDPITDTANPSAVYLPFWSDPEKGFHPVRVAGLPDLGVGDEIFVRLQLMPRGWSLTFEDTSEGSKKTFQEPYGAGERYDFAEWVQEDPESSADTLLNLPYPGTSTVKFTNVEVDGAEPQLGLADGQAMDVVHGPLLVPTPYHSGAFDVVAAESFQAQYLMDVSGSNFAQQPFAEALGGRGSIAATAKKYLSALYAFNLAMSGQTWPPGTADDIVALINANENVEKAVTVLADGDVSQAQQAKTLQLETEGVRYSQAVRTDLGLPPP